MSDPTQPIPDPEGDVVLPGARPDGAPPADEWPPTAPPDRDLVGHDEAPEGVEQIDPLLGLMNPDEGVNSPASDADAPAPPG